MTFHGLLWQNIDFIKHLWSFLAVIDPKSLKAFKVETCRVKVNLDSITQMHKNQNVQSYLDTKRLKHLLIVQQIEMLGL